MDVKIEDSWKKELTGEFNKEYFSSLVEFVKSEYTNYQVFPPGKEIFSAFEAAPFDQVKVVILGQDPYHGPGQAHGLCFSVRKGVPIPPSLRNIYKELNRDIGFAVPGHGELIPWAKQGVLLLNATLTVRAHQAGSHQKRGWETFTDTVISKISEKRENVVFLLWGAYAQSKAPLIDQSKHLVLKSTHPSPLSAHRGFLGCGHFSKVNEFLNEKGIQKISWNID